VFSDVVHVGILSKQLRALLEVDVHYHAIGFGGFVGGNAGEQLAAQLERWCSIRGAVNDIG
jgi:hypothetical protein